MKSNQKEEDLFHLFIQYTDKLPQQANYFPYFEFMQNSIRKSFNQLKKNLNKKTSKNLQEFEEFWQELTNEDKVRVYCNWVLTLRKALELEKNVHMKIEQESMTIQDQIFIKKANFFNKWEKKIAKLTPTHLHLSGRTNKQYQLKNYQIRRSRGKQHFTWVLQTINNLGKTLHCKAVSQSMFQQWYYALTVNINNQKMQYFLNIIKKQRLNPGSVKIGIQPQMQKIRKQFGQQKPQKQKTLTELMIDKQMKTLDQDHENINQIQQTDQDQFQSMQSSNSGNSEPESSQQSQPQMKQNIAKEKKEQTIISCNPNIFKRLAPHYPSLLNFTDTPFNSSLLHSDSQYRIYELPYRDKDNDDQKNLGKSNNQGQFILKMFTVFPFDKKLLFQAITSQSMAWNDQIDVFTVKTKISSQNSALIYQKNKSHGLLYRQRDFLYLRHVFSISNMKQNNTFMIDKSIDSIHHPPFMSVVRAEKKLIWGLVEKENENVNGENKGKEGKECILIVQGWIKGGGYMNAVQNKEMTLRYMKRINRLKGFLKQLSFANNISNNIFKEDWLVDFTNQQANMTQNQYENKKENSKKKPQNQQKKISQKAQQIKHQLEQFMMRTQQQNIKIKQKQKQKQKQKVDEKLQDQFEQSAGQQQNHTQKYIFPPLNGDKSVSIPQQYLKHKYILSPKQKIKPSYAPHIRGHHIWKGQWEILENGGLGYIDQQKMKQQKKVLTYIIKRIGKNLLTGKGILNISLPVDIFCPQSNIQRLANSFSFFPHYLQPITSAPPLSQLLALVPSALSSSLLYITMQKPFNPILGETYQSWIDGCPVYFEQIAHHPPIAGFLMYGRGYRVEGRVQAKMDLAINSGTGCNQGVFKIGFENGENWYFTTSVGCLTGLTYGDRKLNMVGKCYYWNEKGMFLELTYNPAAKTKSFFSSQKGQGDYLLPDYFQGLIKQYQPQSIKLIAFKPQTKPLIPIIPKSLPSGQPIKTFGKIFGRWNKYIKYNNETLFDVDTVRYYTSSDQQNPIPSHSNYREDIVYRRMKNFITSQEWKEILQVRQRQDRKLRAKKGK